MMRPQRFAARAALGGTVFLAGWVAGWLASFGSPSIENTEAVPIQDRGAPRGATYVTADRELVDELQANAMATPDVASPETSVVPASVAVGEVVTADPEPRAPTVGAA